MVGGGSMTSHGYLNPRATLYMPLKKQMGVGAGVGGAMGVLLSFLVINPERASVTSATCIP